MNLRANMAAVRVSFAWLGTRKTLTPEQRAEAAEPFAAQGEYVSAGKKLLDTKHSAFKAVTSIKSKIASTWKEMSLGYPEPGVRLIKREKIDEFVGLMEEYRHELAEAVANLDRHYGELKVAASERLGRLFNPSDYPETLIGLFEVSWDFPSVEPPDLGVTTGYNCRRVAVAARWETCYEISLPASRSKIPLKTRDIAWNGGMFSKQLPRWSGKSPAMFGEIPVIPQPDRQPEITDGRHD
jgi:hypothetical protein